MAINRELYMNESNRRDLVARHRIWSRYELYWKKWRLLMTLVGWFLFYLLLVLLGLLSPGARRLAESVATGIISYAVTYFSVFSLLLLVIGSMLLPPKRASKVGGFLRWAANGAAFSALGMVAFATVKVLGSIVSSGMACVSFVGIVWLLLMPLLLLAFATLSVVFFPAARRVGAGSLRSDSAPRIAAWVLLIFSFISFFLAGNPYEIAGVDGYNDALRSLDCLPK